MHGVHDGAVEAGYIHTQSTELGSPAQVGSTSVSTIGTFGAGHGISGHGAGGAQPGGQTSGVQPTIPPIASRQAELMRLRTRVTCPSKQ